MAIARGVTSLREPAEGRPSPDSFGLVFHVVTPLQDQVGIITPSSLHYVATHRGAFVPDIDPKEHRLMIHGMVDRPLTFTLDDLKRMPSVTEERNPTGLRGLNWVSAFSASFSASGPGWTHSMR